MENLHYTKRAVRLLKNLICNGYIHCNLQITHRCTFKCQICDFWKVEHNKENELSLSEIEIISKKLSKFGTLAISLAGGEPMLREDLSNIIKMIAQYHFPIMITNGWYISQDNAYNLWESGLQEISVSVDYADPEKHDTLRGKKGAFERAIEALRILKNNRPSLRNRVHMISVLLDDNINDIENLILLSKKIGVTYMVNLYSYQRGKKRDRMPEPDKGITKHLLSLKKKYPNFVSLTAYLNKMDAAVQNGGVDDCKAGKYYMNIDNYGNVARCTETTDIPVGNILKEPPEDIRKKLFNVQKTNSCDQCWTSCRGWDESMHGPQKLKTWKEFFISVKSYE